MLNLKNKKALVMGLGLYEDGSGIAATKFLLSHGAKVTVTDLKTRKQLNDQIKRLGQSAEKIEWVLGRHREQDFKRQDLILRNPGVPQSSRFLKIARANKIPIYTDVSLFFQLIDRQRLVGVTGTRGKSTTATLIYELLKTLDRSAVLAGNITKSPLAQMPLVNRGGRVILELSSWMTESLADIKESPHIAVLTNIYPDHLNTYKTMADYIEAKKNIFKFQMPQDYAVLNRDNKKTLLAGREVKAQRYWFSLKLFSEENGAFVKNGKIVFRQNGVEQIMCSIKEVKLLGEHNLSNVLAAIAVAGIIGLNPQKVKLVLSHFYGIPDRLELLKEVRGVKYYNDTTSTTPEATIAALKALSGKKNIVLIAGGSDKGLDFKELAKEIKKHCRAVVLLPGTGTDRLKKLIEDLTVVGSLPDAVGVAKSFAKTGDMVLLSPACASFGLFVNEFDRGKQFRQLVKKIK
ncbi:MAG: UDP-N-acetylmuramoyl-L-alanine--D-glutamate ligase [Patescibacteria group bacterium]|jgi:UDP-N-acetylmuramoylalanine--D-glutamate ligase